MAAATSDACSCKTCKKVCRTIDRIFYIFELYGWILDSYVVDFFQEDLWQRLPESWRDVLEDTSPAEFGAWLGAGDISCKRVWPLSLLALRQIAADLQLNREHRDPMNILHCDRSTKNAFSYASNISSEINVEEILAKANLTRIKYTNTFMRHVKGKKRYEIEKIAEICATCASMSNSKCVVDVGAGSGHLARVLSFLYGLYLTCIEQDELLSRQARKCDQELLQSMEKNMPQLYGKCPQHVSAKIEPSSYASSVFTDNLQTIFEENFKLDKEHSNFGLIGLHPCGDLAATLLRLYSVRPEAKFICIVGCCYMKLSMENEPKGYPLSKYMSTKNKKLSYNTLEVACHAIEKHCDKLKTGNYKDLIVHAYRAVLEIILLRTSTLMRHAQTRNVKVTSNMTFEQYCAAATNGVLPYSELDNSDMQNLQIPEFLNRWQQVVIFGSLRLMLAPLVETIVLLDRFLFLSEQEFCPILKPVFDARLSPRNFVLISVKNNN